MIPTGCQIRWVRTMNVTFFTTLILRSLRSFIVFACRNLSIKYYCSGLTASVLPWKEVEVGVSDDSLTFLWPQKKFLKRRQLVTEGQIIYAKSINHGSGGM